MIEMYLEHQLTVWTKEWQRFCNQVQELNIWFRANYLAPLAQTVKNLPAMQETGFNPQVRKIPWRRAWQPIEVFLPGISHRQKSLWGYSPRGCRVGHDWATNTFSSTKIDTKIHLKWSCTHSARNLCSLLLLNRGALISLCGPYVVQDTGNPQQVQKAGVHL